MTGRSHQRESVLRLAGEELIDAGNDRARRQPRHFKRMLANHRIEVNVRYATFAELANLLDQALAVTARDVFIAGLARRRLRQPWPERGIVFERLKNHAESSGMLWMMAGFMIQKFRVIDQCRSHAENYKGMKAGHKASCDQRAFPCRASIVPSKPLVRLAVFRRFLPENQAVSRMPLLS